MLRWLGRNILYVLLSLPLLLIIGYLCYVTYGWAPRGDAEMTVYMKQYFPLKGENIVAVEGLDITSGAGILGKKRFMVTSDTGSQWLYKADVVFIVLPGQIGPAYKIRKVEKILISGPTAEADGGDGRR